MVANVISRYPTTKDPETLSLPTQPFQMAEIFSNDQELRADAFPLLFKIISTCQNRDTVKDNLLLKDKGPTKHFACETFHGGEQLLCYNRKIYILLRLTKNVVLWCHEYL